jgi:hypothetical protein
MTMTWLHGPPRGWASFEFRDRAETPRGPVRSWLTGSAREEARDAEEVKRH